MSMRLLVLFIMCLGYGCAPTENTAKIAAESVTFPADDLTTYLNGHLLEIPKAGHFVWNGQDISAETLKAYLKQDGGRARIVVQFEPGTPDTRVAWVREQIILVGSCKLSLCAEAPWKAARPVVN